MPKIEKLLSWFGRKERETIESLIKVVVSLDWKTLDIKKLKGYENTFRVRKGDLRVVFAKKEKNIVIISIDRRRESTYKFLTR